jgi:ABC-type multidrug transport system fused ATPase/permease subunit
LLILLIGSSDTLLIQTMKGKGTPSSSSAHGLFSLRSHQKLQDALSLQCKEQQEYIAQLQDLLKQHGLVVPEQVLTQLVASPGPASSVGFHQIEDSSEAELRKIIDQHRQYWRMQDITVEYAHLTYKVFVSKRHEMPSIGSVIRSALFFWRACEEKVEVRILDDVTGRIKPRHMTLLIGPPGSGKSGKHSSQLYYS